MTIAAKLQLTLDTKVSIKNVLIAKGVEPTDTLSSYGALIESLAVAGIATPQIIAPMNGAVQVTQQPIVTGTLYFSADPDDPHAASTWEFASDIGFTNILHTSGRDTVNLGSYDLSAAGYEFPGEATIYVRVTYESQSGVEQTSPISSFQITDMYPGAVIDGDILYGQMNGYWLLAAPATTRVARSWGSNNDDTPLTNTASNTADQNNGLYNTNILVNRGTGMHPAAEYCRSLGDDYFLPNNEELKLLEENKNIVDDNDPSSSGTFLSDIASDISGANNYGRVQSSSELSASSSWWIRFDSGAAYYTSKTTVYWVTPVRSIPI